jgi:ribosomal protein S6
MAEMSHPEASAEGSIQATKDNRPVYEVGFHLMPTIAEDGVGAVVESIRALLGGAEIISQGVPAKMTLSYTIERAAAGKREKFTQSYFGWIKFALEDRSAVPALQESLRGMREVLRYIVIETTREDVKVVPRAVFSSDRLEGETIKKTAVAEKGGQVSQEELDKSIEALTN